MEEDEHAVHQFQVAAGVYSNSCLCYAVLSNV